MAAIREVVENISEFCSTLSVSLQVFRCEAEPTLSVRPIDRQLLREEYHLSICQGRAQSLNGITMANLHVIRKILEHIRIQKFRHVDITKDGYINDTIYGNMLCIMSRNKKIVKPSGCCLK